MKIKLPLFLFLTLVLKISSQNFNWLWANSITNLAFHHQIVNNSNDNLFVAGSFTGSLSIATNTFNSIGGSDVIIVKYDSNGSFIWGKVIGGVGNETITDLGIDLNNNLIIVGDFMSNLISIGATSFSNTSASSDGFILKLDNNGNLLWTNTIKGSNIESINDLSIDINNNILICGNSNSPTLTLGALNYIKTYTTGIAFVLKYNTSGILMWSKTIESSNANIFECNRINTDAQNNIFLVGYIESNSTTSVSIGSSTLQNNPNKSLVYIIKFDALGTQQLIKHLNSHGAIVVHDVLIDKTDNIIFCGYEFTNYLAIGTSSISSNAAYDAYITKFDNNLNFQWLKVFNSSGSPSSYLNTYYKSTVTNSNEILTVGLIASSSCTFANSTYSNNALKTIYLNKYAANGTELESTQIGNTGQNFIYDITSDANGYFYAIGRILNSTFNLGFTVLNSSNGNAFVTKFAPITLGLKNLVDKNQSFSIYPNPARDILYIEINDGYAERSQSLNGQTSTSGLLGKQVLSLTNALGQIVKEEELTHNNTDGYRKEINVKDLQDGIYFLQIKSEGKILANKKFVIEP
jgi:hypothetical protein